MKYTSKSLKDTEKIAREFGKSLKGNEIICLVGDLGAGKTTFTKYLLSSLGVEEDVLSPTFILRSDHKSKKGMVYHFDWYRMDNKEDLLGVDFFDTLYDGIVIIEWADKYIRILDDYKKIIINFEGKDNIRYIDIIR